MREMLRLAHQPRKLSASSIFRKYSSVMPSFSIVVASVYTGLGVGPTVRFATLEELLIP
jgi:hypothetical protein